MKILPTRPRRGRLPSWAGLNGQQAAGAAGPAWRPGREKSLLGNVQFGGPAEKQSTLGRHVHKILAVRGNYLLPIFFGFGSWAKAKAVHDGKNTVKLSGGEYLPEK